MGHYANFKYVITDINGLNKYRFTSLLSPPHADPPPKILNLNTLSELLY